MKKAVAALIVTLGLTVTAARAQELPNLKTKSMTTAVLLGFDPIPGDALLYADKPIQGTIGLIFGGLAAVGFYSGVYKFATGRDDNGYDVWVTEKDEGRILMFLCGIPYFATILWDAIGGIYGVHSHNLKVEAQQTSLWQRVQPTVAVTGNGAFGGVRITF